MTLNLGQIGVGAWGKNLLRNFATLPDVRMLMVCDQDEGRVKKAVQGIEGAAWTTHPSNVFKNPDIRAVVIATPPDSHFPLIMQAFDAGKDVFVEKPMVLRVDHAQQVVERAEAEGRILMVGHIMEYHPGILRVKEYIDSGELGQIYYLYAQRVNLGQVRAIENALWSFAPHDISVILMLTGEAPVTVNATGQAYLQRGVEDVTFVNITFASGVVGHIQVSWLDPHKMRKLTIVGSKKMIVFDDMEPSEKIRLFDKGVDTKTDYNTYAEYLSLRHGDILIPKMSSAEPLRLECEHFVQCLRDNKTPKTDGRDGLRVLKVLDAASKSMQQRGAPVDL